MAKVHWEMLSDRADGSDAGPLALKINVARQLRTTYSPAPSAERVARWPLRALVVGDPGDPRDNASLESARREAIEVANHLRKKGLDVTLLVGAPSAEVDDLLKNERPAKRLDVLNELTRGGYDLLHFAGHADFDENDPEAAGWVFEGGLLTSRLLELIDLAPSLVFANACLTAATSQKLRSGGRAGDPRTEADLLPSLADEFFRRGVRNYIGTAWEVSDVGAREFARKFYDALIPSPDQEDAKPKTLGEALWVARCEVKKKEKEYDALWAAYQHYGDPQHYLVPPDSQGVRR
jgi:CHAT domain-containing protein